MGRKTEPCRICGKPTALAFKLQHVGLSGKVTTIEKIPTHKKCVRPALTRRKSLWTKVK